MSGSPDFKALFKFWPDAKVSLRQATADTRRERRYECAMKMRNLNPPSSSEERPAKSPKKGRKDLYLEWKAEKERKKLEAKKKALKPSFKVSKCPEYFAVPAVPLKLKPKANLSKWIVSSVPIPGVRRSERLAGKSTCTLAVKPTTATTYDTPATTAKLNNTTATKATTAKVNTTATKTATAKANVSATVSSAKPNYTLPTKASAAKSIRPPLKGSTIKKDPSQQKRVDGVFYFRGYPARSVQKRTAEKGEVTVHAGFSFRPTKAQKSLLQIFDKPSVNKDLKTQRRRPSLKDKENVPETTEAPVEMNSKGANDKSPHIRKKNTKTESLQNFEVEEITAMLDSTNLISANVKTPRRKSSQKNKDAKSISRNRKSIEAAGEVQMIEIPLRRKSSLKSEVVATPISEPEIKSSEDPEPVCDMVVNTESKTPRRKSSKRIRKSIEAAAEVQMIEIPLRRKSSLKSEVVATPISEPEIKSSEDPEPVCDMVVNTESKTPRRKSSTRIRKSIEAAAEVQMIETPLRRKSSLKSEVVATPISESEIKWSSEDPEPVCDMAVNTESKTQRRKSSARIRKSIEASAEAQTIEAAESSREKEKSDCLKGSSKKTPRRRSNLEKTPAPSADEPCLPENKSSNISTEFNYVSPNIAVARGSRRRESSARKKKGIATDVLDVKLAASDYFSNLLDSEIDRLDKQCSKWEDVKQQSNLIEEANDMIDVAVGQTRLLINKKFQQFRGLIAQAKDLSSKVTGEDLQGFWDMIYIQVRNLNMRFANLDSLKENNWDEVRPVEVQPQKIVRKTAKKKNIGAKSSASLQEYIKAARLRNKKTTKSPTATSRRSKSGSRSVQKNKATPAKTPVRTPVKTPGKSILKTPGQSCRSVRKTVIFCDD